VVRRRVGRSALLAALLVAAVACSSGERPTMGAEVARDPLTVRHLDPEFTYVASAQGEVDLYAAPGDEQPREAIVVPTADTPIGGLALDGFLVAAPYETDPGWVEVHLPSGGTGWLKADDVTIQKVNVVAVANGTEVDTSGGGGGEIEVFPSPDAPQPFTTVTNPRSAEGLNVGPVVFLAKGPADPTAERIEVYLPIEPNGSSGFVRRNEVTLTTNRFRIDVLLGEHELRVYDGNRKIMDEPVGVGTQDTPTPGGIFYIRSLIASTDPAYGTYAFGLSGFSEVLDTFNGGPGDFGIHGTNDPSTIGTDVSHGCIRLEDPNVVHLAELLPEASGPQSDSPSVTTGLGVPVRIMA